MRYDFISTGVWGVDQILGGGFLKGYVTEVMGDEGAGKTSLAISAIKACEEVAWFDLDGTFPRYIADEKGVTGKIALIQRDTIPLLDAAKGLAPLCDMIVVDPIAVLGARGVLDMVRELTVIALRFYVAVVIVNHCDLLQRSTGHTSISFYAGQRLEVRMRGEFYDEETGRRGMETAVRCVKNVAAPPFSGCSRDIIFAQGGDGVG